MKKLLLAILSVCFATNLWAQEQMALRVSDKGIVKILQMALKYNNNGLGNGIVVPENVYKFTVKKEDLLKDPVLTVINDITSLDLGQNFNFYLHNTDIKINGNIDKKSLTAKISNSHSKGFDLSIGLAIPNLKLFVKGLTLCEDQFLNSRICQEGLNVSLDNLLLKLTGQPIQLAMKLKVKFEGDHAKVKVLSINSNLDSPQAPKLDILFDAIAVPPMLVIVNGERYELDTSELRDVILDNKAELGKKLLSFVGEFMANDLAEMMNVYLANQEIMTSWTIIQKKMPITFNEFLSKKYVPSKLPYVRPTIRSADKGINASNPFDEMMEQISDVIKNAKLAIHLKNLSTPSNKSLEMSGVIEFILNGKKIVVGNTLGNSNRTLPPLNMNHVSKSEINLAISEPLINGALDLVNTTGLYQDLFNKYAGVKGFSIKNARLHFTQDQDFIVIANAEINLRKLESNGMAEWIKYWIAAFIERDNNNAKIYFPLEFRVKNTIKNLPSGGVALDLFVDSPFSGKKLKNTYGYGSNIKKMSDMVRDGVLEELRNKLKAHVNKTYSADLSSFLNQNGVTFKPKSISVDQSAYVVLGLDILDIHFNSGKRIKR